MGQVLVEVKTDNTAYQAWVLVWLGCGKILECFLTLCLSAWWSRPRAWRSSPSLPSSWMDGGRCPLSLRGSRRWRWPPSTLMWKQIWSYQSLFCWTWILITSTLFQAQKGWLSPCRICEMVSWNAYLISWVCLHARIYIICYYGIVISFGEVCY